MYFYLARHQTYQINSILSPLILSSLLAAPCILIAGYSSVADCLTRINPNDALLGTYYFWWTSLTYLPALFFLLSFCALVRTFSFRPASIGLVLAAVLCFYCVELLDFLPLNHSNLTYSYNLYGINQLLSNTMNRYHPLMLYLSFISFGSLLILLLRTSPSSSLHGPVQVAKHLYTFGWCVVVLNLVALWMGSWWALQEGTWGGWWNWDSSEMLGLTVTLALLSILHTHLPASNYASLRLKAVLLLAAVAESYFFLQLNFELVSHNFGSKFFFFFNNNLFFIEVLVFMLAVQLMVLRSFFPLYEALGLRLNVPKAVLPLPYLLKVVPTSIALFWVFWSYRPLFNYFFWNFFEVNVLNAESSIQPANVLAALTLILLVARFSRFDVVTILIASSCTLNWLWVLVFIPVRFSRFSFVHFSFCLFTLLNLTLCNSTLFHWGVSPPYNYVLLSNSLEFVAYSNATPDSGVVEVSKYWSNFTNLTSINWNMFGSANAPTLNFFSLEFSHSLFRNLYDLGSVYSTAYLDLEIPLIGTLNLIFFAVVFTLLL